MAHYISQPRLEGPIWLEPSDLYFLRNLVAETSNQAESLKKQIKQADKDHIAALIHEKDAKIVKLASLRNILSPVRRMPLEVLSEILELSCLPVNGIFTAKFPIMWRVYSVSLVCVAWRKAAFCTPKLWSKICINDAQYPAQYPDAKQMKEWLVRSKGLPLELYISMLYAFESQMACILQFRDQIAVIDLSRGGSSAFLPLFRLPRASFPLLEKLVLDIANSDIAEYLWNVLSPSIGAFFGAPRLQHLSIRETSDVSMLAKLVLPVEQLTSLEIQVSYEARFDLDVYRKTLHRCKALVSLKVDSSRGLGFDSDLSICLPSLKFLDISCRDVPPHHFTLLHGLTTPVLEGLVLHCVDRDIHELCRDVVGLQHGSVTTLTLCCAPHSWRYIEDLPLLLATFPMVQSFRIDAGKPNYDIDDLIQAMVYSKSQPVLLPRLTSLDISFSERLRADSVISLIHSRWWSDSMVSEMSDDIGVARLQKVTLCGWNSDRIVKRDDFNFPTLIVDFDYRLSNHPSLRYY